MTDKTTGISWNEVLEIFNMERFPIPGDPNKLTKATKKDHIHVVNPAAKPSKGLSSKARARRHSILAMAGHHDR